MATVHVSNISSKTTEKEVKDFFSFCGKISNISVTPSSGSEGAPQSATVTFERESAAKTALLLDNTQLGDSQVKVESTHDFSDMTDRTTTAHDADHHEIRQEDKPRTAVIAEYLSHGYVVGDQMVQKAMDLDKQHGITSRFSQYLTQMDEKMRATDKARAADQTYGISDKASQGYNTLSQYFEAALDTPTGKRIRTFYDTGSKQVLDVHNEARRLADLRAQQSGGTQTREHHAGESTSEKKDAGPAVPQGDGTTKCSCAGNEGICACAPGSCSCKDCPK